MQPTNPDDHHERYRVLFSTGCMYTESSGIYLSLKQTVSSLSQRSHHCTTIGTRSRTQPSTIEGWDGDAIGYLRTGPFSMHYCRNLKRNLEALSQTWDVASLQGLWLHNNSVVAEYCNERDIPFMVTTHGCLNPRALAVSTWKKWIALRTFMRPIFEKAACFQASTQAEYETLRGYGIKKPICIIGNGIIIPPTNTVPSEFELDENLKLGSRNCVYFGRLDPIKGLDLLLQAWRDLSPPDDWKLTIVGRGTPQYETELRRLANQCKPGQIQFTGFVSSERKTQLIKKADFCVLPSRSEAFAMAPMEAFANSKPMLMTKQCGLPEAAIANAAVEVDCSKEAISSGLSQMLNNEPKVLEVMGNAAKEFVVTRYDWKIICNELESVYAWMLRKAPPPLCLKVD